MGIAGRDGANIESICQVYGQPPLVLGQVNTAHLDGRQRDTGDGAVKPHALAGRVCGNAHPAEGFGELRCFPGGHAGRKSLEFIILQPIHEQIATNGPVLEPSQHKKPRHAGFVPQRLQFFAGPLVFMLRDDYAIEPGPNRRWHHIRWLDAAARRMAAGMYMKVDTHDGVTRRALDLLSSRFRGAIPGRSRRATRRDKAVQ